MAKPSKSIAVVDIGSNSVRLVLFQITGKKHELVYEKKATCGLARGMSRERPRLDKRGMVLTLKTLRKFRTVLKKRKPQKTVAVGTAAMRSVADTKQGRKFRRRAEKALGAKIDVISGRKEARLTAYGVMGTMPKAAGICGDLGGGSLELAVIGRGRAGHTATLALGSLTLLNEAGRNMPKVRKLMHQRLQDIAWLGKAKGRCFYPIGGSWRAVARVMMKHSGKPIRAVHGFTISAKKAQKYALAIARKKPKAFRKMHKKIRHRADTIPVAAAVLAELIERMQPRLITFSAHGLREGLLYEALA